MSVLKAHCVEMVQDLERADSSSESVNCSTNGSVRMSSLVDAIELLVPSGEFCFTCIKQIASLANGLKDRQQSIRAILVWSQYIEDWCVPPKILYTYYIPLRS